MTEPHTDKAHTDNALSRGAALIRSLTGALPDTPGVYRMLGERDEVLYVGKAKALKRRVLAYTVPARQPVRIQRMIAQTLAMEFVHTHTEAEALLLESSLIKKLKPRYNVLLRDDKSFPYILVTGDHDFPMIAKHRGPRSRKGEYFGPFAGAADVNRTLEILQRAFRLRTCSDSVFRARTRPCLQYHIKRCTAPCVGHVNKDQYAEQIGEALQFLRGKSRAVQDRMLQAMQDASAREDYEDAASWRDRLRTLTSVQQAQGVSIGRLADADVIALAREGGKSAVQVFVFRAGQAYGNRAYFPRHDAEEGEGTIMAAFLAQFYENKPLPPALIVSHAPDDKAWLESALSQKAGRTVKIMAPARGELRRTIDFAVKNARAALERRNAENAGQRDSLERGAVALGLEFVPARIEVYDNSHVSGTHRVGAMIAAGPEGFIKSAYRKYNIRADEGSADDYAMMREVMTRRFRQVDETGWPDVILIDGGRGHYNAVRDVLANLGVPNTVTLAAIAKGRDRNAGREEFFIGDKNFRLPPDDPALHYFQRLRDEAHRFAITAHRAKRAKALTASPLDDIEGIGAARKKALLHHFGSGRAVASAGISDLLKVSGISKAMAEKIYGAFH